MNIFKKIFGNKNDNKEVNTMTNTDKALALITLLQQVIQKKLLSFLQKIISSIILHMVLVEMLL